MGNLFRKATDPYQYDNSGVNWREYEAGLESPTRANFWEYLKPLSLAWRGKEVLDIGSGTGWLLELALKQGAKSVLGIEPSKKNVELGKRLYPDVRVLNVTFEEFKVQGRYDIAIALFSLGHIHDIEAAFKKIYLTLKPQSELIAVVPDYDYCRKDRFGYKITVEDVDYDEYIAMVERPETTTVDIIRSTSKYVELANKCEFALVENKPLPPTELLMKKNPRYKKMVGIAMAQLLRFRK
ncbi:MAG: hypothetical protein A3H17_04350 [Candidatus Levybacteria bacterium RIFCSPLOWO2_12_FULL_37_14]|nr:MAG: Methyltransferase domain protein [Candidatus Levybacteria bacterium GW2011_GWA1_37_16]KKQ37242.1 MAG: Methyltransferase domain protein [Candidatus Levybacteria bacterium GW2011_GWC2_37_7]KKQ42361.1 MAG: Methyltransferase domain protein [Candidatus Levybacteria bacterium GW2011_GWB1_37_8]OGH50415.1 MAG: hypothetical protein A3H17_04350 [Candidatus Levybacteria bacterium RIFCSPLOWO2_12_FULL_37_14]